MSWPPQPVAPSACPRPDASSATQCLARAQGPFGACRAAAGGPGYGGGTATIPVGVPGHLVCQGAASRSLPCRLDTWTCDGTERRLDECRHGAWKKATKCTHSEDVSVQCGGLPSELAMCGRGTSPDACRPPACPAGPHFCLNLNCCCHAAAVEVRLVGGNAAAGRLEIRFPGLPGGQWGTVRTCMEKCRDERRCQLCLGAILRPACCLTATGTAAAPLQVCNARFTDLAAAVVCRQLGFRRQGQVVASGKYGAGSGPIW